MSEDGIPVAYTTLTQDDWVLTERPSRAQRMLRSEGLCAVVAPHGAGSCTRLVGHVGGHSNVSISWDDPTRVKRIVGNAEGEDFTLEDGVRYLVRTKNMSARGTFDAAGSTSMLMRFKGDAPDEWFYVNLWDFRDVSVG